MPAPVPPSLTHSPYLTPADAQRLRRFDAAPAPAPAGARFGHDPAAGLGDGGEFAEHRRYAPGDDAARIDWHVLARTDRCYVKRYEHRAQRSVHVLLDASASMAFAGFDAPPQPPHPARWTRRLRRALDLAIRGETDVPPQRSHAAPPTNTKYDHAARLAAAMLFLALHHRHRASLSFARRGLADHLPATARLADLPTRLDALAQHRNDLDERADLANAAAALLAGPSRSRGAGSLVIITDLFEPVAPTLAVLRAWRARGGEARVCRVVHPHEIRPPLTDGLELVDSESGESLRVPADAWRGEHPRRIERHAHAWRCALHRAAVPIETFPTDRPHLPLLQRFLAPPAAGRM